MKNKYIFSLVFIITSLCMSEQKQKVLVTGGAGYVGSHIVFVLAQKGYDVIVLDHACTRKHPWATYIEADYADDKVLHEIFTQHQIEAVFHCAAYAIVSESIILPLKFYENNIAKTIKLLEVMLAHKVNRIIFASSRSIYGNAQFLPITEEHPKNPLSPYARTKLMTEFILEDLAKAYGLQYVSLRFVNAVGALPEYGVGEDHHPETHVFPLLIEAARKGKPFTIYGEDFPTRDGTCVRTYIHVMDIAQANYLAFEYLMRGGQSEIFQLGSQVNLSILEMVAAVEKYYHTKISIIVKPRRPADSPELISDYSKIHRILGFETSYSTVENIIKSMDEFEKFKEAEQKDLSDS